MVECSLPDQKALERIIAALSFVIPSRPHIVALMAHTYTQDLPLTSHNPSLIASEAERTLHLPQKQSLLHFLLTKFIEEDRALALHLFIHALIEPHTQNQLVLYKNEVITTSSYHIELVVNFLIDELDKYQNSQHKALFKQNFTQYTKTMLLIFRDVHLWTSRDMDVYYKLCNKIFETYAKNLEEVLRDQLPLTLILACSDPLKDRRLFSYNSGILKENKSDAIIECNLSIASACLGSFYQQLTSDLIIKEAKNPELQKGSYNLLSKLSPQPITFRKNEASSKAPQRAHFVEVCREQQKMVFLKKLARVHMDYVLEDKTAFRPLSIKKQVQLLLSRIFDPTAPIEVPK